MTNEFIYQALDGRAYSDEATAKGEAADMEIFTQPNSAGRRAAVRLQKGGVCDARNDRGDRLLCDAKVLAAAEGFQFEIRLPYTVVKHQGEWATGIEHGRYSIRAGQASRNLHLVSTEQQVQAWLRRELVEGLYNWNRLFRQFGYIPNAYGANVNRFAGVRHDKISENGGYAHLITAAAQYLLYLEGKNDWENAKYPRPK